MVVMALKHRTEKHPAWPTFNPKYWKPVWKMQGLYTPTGYRLNLIGWILFGLGGIIFIAFLMR